VLILSSVSSGASVSAMELISSVDAEGGGSWNDWALELDRFFVREPSFAKKDFAEREEADVGGVAGVAVTLAAERVLGPGDDEVGGSAAGGMGDLARATVGISPNWVYSSLRGSGEYGSSSSSGLNLPR
jgi:hypothetical protein